MRCRILLNLLRTSFFFLFFFSKHNNVEIFMFVSNSSVIFSSLFPSYHSLIREFEMVMASINLSYLHVLMKNVRISFHEVNKNCFIYCLLAVSLLLFTDFPKILIFS